MTESKFQGGPVTIELTAEQREQIRKATGLNVETVDLTLETLEERTSPGCIVKTVDKATPL